METKSLGVPIMNRIVLCVAVALGLSVMSVSAQCCRGKGQATLTKVGATAENAEQVAAKADEKPAAVAEKCGAGVKRAVCGKAADAKAACTKTAEERAACKAACTKTDEEKATCKAAAARTCCQAAKPEAKAEAKAE